MQKRATALMIVLLMMFFTGCDNSKQTSDGKSNKIITDKSGFLIDNDEVQLFEKANGGMLEGADPHILHSSDGNYYMYVTGQSKGINLLPAFKSKDLKKWESITSVIAEKPYVDTGVTGDRYNNILWNYWSPDVYEINGKYYLFVTGPVLKTMSDDYIANQLDISIYVSESDSPIGPFEEFVMIKPRNDELNAPRTVLNKDSTERIFTEGYKYYMPLRMDFHMFKDPNTQKTYVSFTGLGNPASKEENGNHIVIFELANPEFVSGDDGKTPGFYYDYIPESVIHASNPLDWPEFGETIFTTKDKEEKLWQPQGYPFRGYTRGVTEAPNLIYKDGWYQLYFSVNTWDSPLYQIISVMVKDLKNLDIEKRKQLSASDKKIGILQKPQKSQNSFTNYGSGGILTDNDGKSYYIMHILTKNAVRKLGYKEIGWELSK